MSDVKWIKIVTDIFDDLKVKYIETMPNGDTTIVIWFRLLCLAGKSNQSGLLMMTDKIAYTDEMLASIFNRDIKVIQLALMTFEKLGMIEISENVIALVNWEKHQNQEKMELIREYDRARKKQQREGQKLRITEVSRKCPGNVPDTIRKVREIDKELDKDKDIKDLKDIKSVQEVGQSVARASKSDNKGGIELANYIGDREELQEAVKQFIKMRKEIRKPMTDQAKSLLVKEMQKLEKSGENIVDCLNASILNSWQGLFPKRKQPLNNGVEAPPWIDTNIKPHEQINNEVDIDKLIEDMQRFK